MSQPPIIPITLTTNETCLLRIKKIQYDHVDDAGVTSQIVQRELRCRGPAAFHGLA